MICVVTYHISPVLVKWPKRGMKRLLSVISPFILCLFYENLEYFQHFYFAFAHSRSIADGQSQHSFSNHSHRGYLNTAFPSNLVNSRPGLYNYSNDSSKKTPRKSKWFILLCWSCVYIELRQSRQSLAAASDRISRASYAGAAIHAAHAAHSVASNARRARPRSRSRDQLNGSHMHAHRPNSR